MDMEGIPRWVHTLWSILLWRHLQLKGYSTHFFHGQGQLHDPNPELCVFFHHDSFRISACLETYA